MSLSSSEENLAMLVHVSTNLRSGKAGMALLMMSRVVIPTAAVHEQ